MTNILFRRRGLLAAIALASLRWRVNAQERVRRVGVLNGVIQHDEGEALVGLFRETLANLGWRVGQNLELEVRWSTASAESTRRAAEELLRWNPDVILARNTISVEKLLELKTELPIVFVSVFDPFGSGFVTEVTRPGKNITGFTTHDYGMAVKWVEFLKLVAPQVTRVALLFNRNRAVCPTLLRQPFHQGCSADRCRGERGDGPFRGRDRQPDCGDRPERWRPLRDG
jgi:putative tryptophan/tyrosine transport system substrate-binding protein